MDEERIYNPYTGSYMQAPSAAKVRKEIVDRTANTFREAKNTDPELVINVVVILFLQFLLFRFLTL